MAADHPSLTSPLGSQAAGYAAVIERHDLKVMPHHRWTFVATRGGRRELADGRFVMRAPHLSPDEMSDVEHLLLSLKHDGIALPVLGAAFELPGLPESLADSVRATPTGKYHRQLWYLFEWMTGERLEIADTVATNYVRLLDRGTHLTGPERPSKRHAIIDNQLGGPAFCPMVRRTTALDDVSNEALAGELERIVDAYDEDVIARAVSYLFTKETMSSFAIEREKPSASRAERFVASLRSVRQLGLPTEEALTEMQAAIVDPRFAEDGFRTEQNYVGQALGLHRQRIHFVPPKPDDVGPLMEGWLAMVREAPKADAAAWAACIAFAFAFIHPFVDGNGRLHRFLIHWLLAHRGVTPEGLVIPVSAVMLQRRREYDEVLELVSRPLSRLLDYELDEDGRLEVHGTTARHYRYLDLTAHAEALARWLRESVREDLPAELEFLVGLREARARMVEIVDLPDRLADLFIKVCLADGGKLSKRKRDRHFGMLSDEEIADLEGVVRSCMSVQQRDRVLA